MLAHLSQAVFIRWSIPVQIHFDPLPHWDSYCCIYCHGNNVYSHILTSTHSDPMGGACTSDHQVSPQWLRNYILTHGTGDHKPHKAAICCSVFVFIPYSDVYMNLTDYTSKSLEQCYIVHILWWRHTRRSVTQTRSCSTCSETSLLQEQ